ncbi:MAG: glycoside hydrolase family 66 protein [Alicyclobacillus sp.]|nr:glycoside hydrolase family 66 protein [Alicyclobacillus sp.]
MACTITDFFPEKAQYRPGESILLAAEIHNSGSRAETVTLNLEVMRLQAVTERTAREITIPGGERSTVEFSLAPREDEPAGYGADLYLYRDGQLEQITSTAFDVAADKKTARYGFLCDFAEEDRGDAEDVALMARFHLNMVQFYDWSSYHDHPIPEAGSYTDPMGRRLCRAAVEEKIAACRARGMKALAYAPVYAAGPDFYRAHRDWALYDTAGNPHHLGHLFFIMNPDRTCPWHDHILAQYRRIIEEMGFDGLHLDTYGFPKVAFTGPDRPRRTVRLDRIYPAFIRDVRESLRDLRPEATLVFNAVGNWPIEAVAPAEQDVVYIEVWPPYDRYHHLKELIAWARLLGGGKPVILAAYLAPFAAKGEAAEAAALTAALILTAVVTAHGGYHLLLGEGNGALTEGYYPRYARLGAKAIRALRDYYDFLVRYGEIFFDPELADVYMTHAGGENREYTFTGEAAFSSSGEPGKVWTVIRERPGRKTVSLINLTAMNDDRWNEGKEPPPVLRHLEIRMQVEGRVGAVYQASPDEAMGRPMELPYRIEIGPRGRELVISLAELRLFCLVVAEIVLDEG